MKDYLWLNLRELPYFRAFLRAIEARFYQEYPLAGPVLDLGCGDGHFAEITFDKPLDVGLDPWTGPLRLASRRQWYPIVVQGLGDDIPFKDGYFGAAVSNSVLEHIPDLDPVLAEMGRVIRPGGLFLFCVPNHNFLPNLSVAQFFDRLGLKKLARSYRNFFNTIARHRHCDPPEVWEDRLERAGFRVEKWWHYFSPQALHALEWGHYFGLPSLITHFIFRKWVLVPSRWNLALALKIVEPFYHEKPEQPVGTCTFYVARRK
jgi:SAM-dependent methyltransferase